MKRVMILVFSVLVIVSGYFLFSKNEPVANVKTCSSIDTKAILRDINETRIEHGLNSLVVDQPLKDFADKRSADLNGSISSGHSGFKSFLDSQVIPGFSYFGENLAVNHCPESGKWFIGSWMDSESHRNNILDKRFDTIGVSYHRGVVVTIFGDKK